MSKSRRFRAAFETNKEFYARRKKEEQDILASDAWKYWLEKTWAEYKKANKLNGS
tara:strand:+ start:8262 stop:8426 length:165 start_codon:yes stop_codon:yes gene_type:complete